ncbi:MAG: response regulator transcription factor, partial [Chitinophagaceae bacterium]
MRSNIRIIIADDHELFAEGLKLLLSQSGNLDVVGIANDGRNFLEMVKARPADIVLLDISMPKLNGLDVIRYLKMHNSTLKIIVLSTYAELHVIAKAQELGADGYILKNSNPNYLMAAVQNVILGGSSFPDVPKPLGNVQITIDPFLQSFQ